MAGITQNNGGTMENYLAQHGYLFYLLFAITSAGFLGVLRYYLNSFLNEIRSINSKLEDIYNKLNIHEQRLSRIESEHTVFTGLNHGK